MKKWITLVELLTLCCAMVNVIPYPKMVEEGTEVLKVPLCEIHPVFGENTNQEMKDIWEASEEMLLGKGSKCSQGFSILISQSQSQSCKSEKYSLKISQDGISIITECSVGLSRAIATLYQLSQIEGETVIFQNVPISIDDSPRFPHRGIMVDTARHFLKLSILKRIIDGMMIAKLNVLHWHLVDDDSFPMESEQIPDLAKNAAFSPTQIYSKQDIQNIVAYAKSKGVRVIPEIDCPGHNIAVGKYEPLRELVTCWNSIWPHRGLEKEGLYRIHGGPPTGALDPSMDQSYEFLEKIFKDLVNYFDDEYIHLGGDEVMYNSCWGKRESIKKFMKEHNIQDYQHLMNYFVTRAREILTKLDKKRKTIYWSNSATFNLKYKDGDALQYWGASEDIHRLKDLYPKNKFILSPYDYFYLDCGYGNRYGGNSWCGYMKTWIHMYMFEPTNFNVPENMILGGEVCGWSELFTDFDTELRLWPRVVGMAETLWQPKRTGEVDLINLVKRINSFAEKLNAQGIPTEAISKQYCQLHPEECYKKVE